MQRLFPGVILGCVVVWGQLAVAQSALPPAVDAFVTSAAALSKAADEPAQLGRSTFRNDLIKMLLTEKLRAGGSNLQLSELDETKLLCDARTATLVFAAQKNYLHSVSAKIDEVGKPSKIENLSDAIGVLFSHQTIDVKDIADEAGLEKQMQSILKLCKDDLAKFEIFYYGTTIKAPPAAVEEAMSFGAFGPAGSLVDTIIAIITPVVVEGAKMIDEQQRRAAVLEFLTAANIKKIQDAGQNLSDRVSDAVSAKRRILAGAYSENLALLRSKTINLAKVEGCANLIALSQKDGHRASGAPNDEFVSCWAAVRNTVAPLMSSVLKSASEYDDFADAGDGANAKKSFELMSKSLNAIANKDQTLSPSELRSLWKWAVELVAFAQKVTEAVSPENRKKLDDAIDKLVKSL